jgi:branched-subunit amino acid transport protein
MSTQEILLIAGMMAVTFGVRYLPLLFAGRIQLPERALRALRYVPVAVLTAIIVPAALMPQGTIDLRLQNAWLWAAIGTAGIAWRTRNLLYTIAGGMALFVIWRVLLGG